MNIKVFSFLSSLWSLSASVVTDYFTSSKFVKNLPFDERCTNSFGEVPRNLGCRVSDKAGCEVIARGQNAHIRNEQFFGVAHLFMQSER